jgi:LysM domain-containing protein
VYDRTQYGSNEGLITEGAMNAMPAVTRPCGSGIRPRHGVAPRPARDPRRASSQGALRRGALRRAGAPDVALRLTRRGRVLVAAVAALLVTVVSLLAAGAAQATNHGLPPGAARQNLIRVVVRPGQSLWSVAESADPDQDTRAVIHQIVDLNALSGDVVFAGQQLWVPRG